MSSQPESIAIGTTLRRLSMVMCRTMQKKLPYAESATPKEQPSMLPDSRGVAKSGLLVHVPDVRLSFWNTAYIRLCGRNHTGGARTN